MNGFEKRREQKKENIRIAALKLFTEFGFDKVTIKEIADTAGVSPVSIYNFFGSKEELLRFVIKNLLDTIISEVYKEMDEHHSSKEKMGKILFLKKDFIKNKYWSFIVQASETDLVIRNYLEEIQDKSTELFSDIIDMGRKDGLINKELSSEAILIFMDLFKAYFMLNESKSIQIENNEKLFEELNKMFWKALS